MTIIHDYYAYYLIDGGLPGRRHLTENDSSSNHIHMINSFHHLPPEIVRIILSYNGTIKERNGLYMNQLPTTDVRYRMLLTIPRKHFSYTFTQVDIKHTHRLTVSWRGRESVEYLVDNIYSYSKNLFTLA